MRPLMKTSGFQMFMAFLPYSRSREANIAEQGDAALRWPLVRLLGLDRHPFHKFTRRR
jgi:hypothetical protein